MAFPRRLAFRLAGALAVSALLTACGHHGARPPATSSGKVSTPTAAPAPSLCGDPAGVPAAMKSTRDKLGQLLMVGVKDAADAKAVVLNHHVGGIFVGSWTDLRMLTDGSLKQLVDTAGPLRLAVSVDEEGGRVSRLKKLIGPAPSAKELAQ